MPTAMRTLLLSTQMNGAKANVAMATRPATKVKGATWETTTFINIKDAPHTSPKNNSLV